jgi:uncharacterized integral membrane protein (TIGR00698 family)
MNDTKYPKILFYFLCALCLFPFVSAPLALLGGILFASVIGNPLIEKTQKLTHKFLQFSVVGLGFGMNAAVALEAGKQGLLYTICGITLTFIFGFLISRFLKVDKTTAYLISAGTAICGGSAIAAVAPVIKAKNENTSVALGVVFTLNSIALLLFPYIGHRLGLSQSQFGLWSAIAIHDTSSVVGASAQYGTLALATATTIKLTRALWIVPVSFVSGLAFKSGSGRAKVPLFIILFFAAMIMNTYITPLHGAFQFVYALSKQALVLTLFLIGSNLSLKTVKTVGARPFVMGILLWILISSLSLFAVEKLM